MNYNQKILKDILTNTKNQKAIKNSLTVFCFLFSSFGFLKKFLSCFQFSGNSKGFHCFLFSVFYFHVLKSAEF